jgi:hypothetical protein
MTPLAFFIPDDVNLIAFEHGLAMRPANFEADTIVGLIDIARRIVNRITALLELGNIPVGKSAIFLAPVPHRTYEIDVHEPPFLTAFNYL